MTSLPLLLNRLWWRAALRAIVLFAGLVGVASVVGCLIGGCYGPPPTCHSNKDCFSWDYCYKSGGAEDGTCVPRDDGGTGSDAGKE